MRKHLLTATAAAALLLGAPTAMAQVDPTDLHLSASGATGTDPVQLNTSQTFSVTDVPSGQNQAKDAFNLELILAVPVFGSTPPAVPTIGTLTNTMSGVTATAGTEVNVTTALESGNLLFGTGSTAKDLYSYLVPPCTVCDNSLNQNNFEGSGTPLTGAVFDTLFTAAQLGMLAGFDVFEIPISFNNLGSDLLANQTLTTAGDNLPLGTYVAALAFESDGVTPLATSFTNTGLVNRLGAPPPPPVPEPSSLILLGTALLGLGWLRRRVS